MRTTHRSPLGPLQCDQRTHTKVSSDGNTCSFLAGTPYLSAHRKTAFCSRTQSSRRPLCICACHFRYNLRNRRVRSPLAGSLGAAQFASASSASSSTTVAVRASSRRRAIIASWVAAANRSQGRRGPYLGPLANRLPSRHLESLLRLYRYFSFYY